MTDKQQAILEFIRACDEEGEPPPTIREIMDVVGISSTSVVNYELDALVSAGHITRNRTVSRGIRLAGKASSKLSELVEIVQVHQVQIEDLQAELRRLRQHFILVKKVERKTEEAPIDEADWQAANRLARQ